MPVFRGQNRKWNLLQCIIFVLGFLLIVVGCHKTPDEQQISAIIEAMKSAVESGKTGDISNYLHQDFRANGEMTAQQAKQMLMLQGMQHQILSLTVVSSKTTIDPTYTDRAETELSVIVTSTGESGLPNDGSVHVVKLTWRKDGDWKLFRADW